MKPLTIGVAAGTHQYQLIDELWASLRPIAPMVEFILDVTCTGGNLNDYVAKTKRVTSGLSINLRTRQSGCLGESRNHVLDSARTPFVMFMDGDDFLDSGKLVHIIQTVTAGHKPPEVAVFAGKIYENGNTTPWLSHLLPTKPLEPGFDTLQWFADFGWRMTSACVKVYSVSWLRAKKIRFVEELFYEDTPLWFDIMMAADQSAQIEFFNLEIYNYRRWGNQITETKDARLFHFFWIIDLVRERLIKANAHREIWVAFNAFVLDHLVWSSHRMNESSRSHYEKRLFQTLVDEEARNSRDYLKSVDRYYLPPDPEKFLIRDFPGDTVHDRRAVRYSNLVRKIFPRFNPAPPR